MDPRGESIFSKALAKLGRQALTRSVKRTIEVTLKKHLSHLGPRARKELQKDVKDIYDILDSFSDPSLWDLVEWVPVAGDTVGACRLGYDFYKVKKKLDALSRKVLKKRRIRFKTVKKNYWKRHGVNGKPPKRRVLVIDKNGKRKEIIETKVLHHKTPIRDGGGDEDANLMEVWPGQHCEVDPCRNIGYTVIKVIGEVIQ